MQPTAPNLSKTAYDILGLLPDGYRSLLAREGPGAAAAELLAQIPPEKLVINPAKDARMLQSIAAGLWLWHDGLHQAHTLAQQIDTETGALWHAIVHRRQGDFANSKQWYAKCPNHPALMAINNQAGVVLNDLPADNRLIRLTLDGWNSAYLVDLVEQYHGLEKDEFHHILVVLQQLEWRVLLEYCAAMA